MKIIYKEKHKAINITLIVHMKKWDGTGKFLPVIITESF